MTTGPARVVFVRVLQDARTPGFIAASRGRDFLLEAGSLRAELAGGVRLMPNDGSFQIFTASIPRAESDQRRKRDYARCRAAARYISRTSARPYSAEKAT